jgi:hypothetical protein
MPRRSEEIEDRFFEVYSKLAENRDMIYTLWEMVESLKTQVQGVTRQRANSRRRGKRGGKTTARASRK